MAVRPRCCMRAVECTPQDCVAMHWWMVRCPPHLLPTSDRVAAIRLQSGLGGTPVEVCLLCGLKRWMLIDRRVWKAVWGQTATSVQLGGFNHSTLTAGGVWKGSCQAAEQDPRHHTATSSPSSRFWRKGPARRCARPVTASARARVGQGGVHVGARRPRVVPEKERVGIANVRGIPISVLFARTLCCSCRSLCWDPSNSAGSLDARLRVHSGACFREHSFVFAT